MCYNEPEMQHTNSDMYRIVEIFQRELRKTQLDQTLPRALCQLPELLIVLLVAHQVLQICIGECTEKTIAIRPGPANRFVFR